MSPEEEVVRAGQANEILENERFKEAVAQIEEALKHGRLSSSIKDTEMREKLWAQEVALHSLIANLRSVVETGQLAKEQLRQEGLRERAKKFFSIN